MTQQAPSERDKGYGLWAYNLRILLGNSYWLIITPVAGAQLVLFWNMAVVSMSTATLGVQTVEMLAPILGAFLCAHALAAEQGKVGELIFVRPLSIERVLVLRLAVALAFVLVLLSPILALYHLKVEAFPLGLALLAAFPPMLFVSLLALGIATATGQPLLGFAGAGAFWALDLATGGYLNPLVSLHSFADWVAGRPLAELCLLNKLALTFLAFLLYLWTRGLLGRPPSAFRWRTAARRALLVILLAIVYLAAGAGYKVGYGLRHESELGPRAQLWYEGQFRGYGPVPLSRLFGPAFALYVSAPEGAGAGRGTAAGIARLRLLQERYPKSIWADNAQLVLAIHALAQPRREPLLAIACHAGQGDPARKIIDGDLSGARHELQTLVDGYPDSPFAPFALSQLATMGLSQLDFDLAVSSYERVIQRYPRAPEAYTAGLRLSAYYLDHGRPEDALTAADIAAGVATWDVRADALVAGAQAAEQAGDAQDARDRYQRARAAAASAAERSVGGARSPTHLTRGQLLERADAVMAQCDRFLSYRPVSKALGRPAGECRVSGRVLWDSAGVRGARVALGAAADPGGFPSPFAGGPAVAAPTEEDGTFAIGSVPRGQYPVLAVALRVPAGSAERGLSMGPPALPANLDGPSAELPDIRLRVLRPSLGGAPEAAGRRSALRSAERPNQVRRGRRGGGGRHPGGRGRDR